LTEWFQNHYQNFRPFKDSRLQLPKQPKTNPKLNPVRDSGAP
jgi:hypothetical protein